MVGSHRGILKGMLGSYTAETRRKGYVHVIKRLPKCVHLGGVGIKYGG